jgi:hypothetical protein
VLDSEEKHFSEYPQNAVVPISPKDNQYSAILQEYNPMKNE